MRGPTKVLDHGYVQLVESWGSDERIIESARMSTGKGFLGWGDDEGTCTLCGLTESQAKERAVSAGRARDFCASERSMFPPHHDFQKKPGDEKLLRFLWNNDHATPFEMGGLTIEVAAPIFVFREWHRHRVPFGYNEMSARYVPLPDVAFLPEAHDAVARSEAASRKNKQAGLADGAAVLTLDAAERLLAKEAWLLGVVEELYQEKLKAGFTKELARTHVTVSRYSRMRATGNLRGWLAFLKLRTAPNVQQEFRAYAEEVGKLVAALFPRTWALFAESRAK